MRDRLVWEAMVSDQFDMVDWHLEAWGFCRRGTGGDVLSIWAPSVEPEGTLVSSWGSSIDPGAGACRAQEQAKTPVGLIRPGGSPPRPRRTGAAGRTAALATEWPFQRRGAAGR